MPVAKQPSSSATKLVQACAQAATQKRVRLKIPVKAPALWPGRCYTGEDVADFVRRVWAKYLPAGLTLRDIEKLDVKLYNAIRNYHSVTNKAWPKDLARISERGRLADAVARAEQDGVKAVTPKELMAVARKLARDHSPS